MRSAQQIEADLRQIEAEKLIVRHAEHKALKYFNGANPTHIANIYKYPTECTVYDKKGNARTLHLSCICNEKPWKKFLSSSDAANIDLDTLAYNVEKLAHILFDWFLRGGYSDLYTYAKSPSARHMLRTSCFIMAIHFMLMHMYHNHSFHDKWVENEVGTILRAQEYAKEVHKATGHAKKHDEDLPEAQEDIYRRYLALLQASPYIQYQELTSLPVGTPDPLPMPDDEEGEDDE